MQRTSQHAAMLDDEARNAALSQVIEWERVDDDEDVLQDLARQPHERSLVVQSPGGSTQGKFRDASEVTHWELVEDEAKVLETTDVDGWCLDRSQLDLVEQANEDLKELRLLRSCCGRQGNHRRLEKAIQEFEVKLRVRRTWAWFPLTRYEWSGFEHEAPILTLDFRVPGVGALPTEDIHCDFGKDSFDLKVWNVEWPEDLGVKYHHRVKKTRLMRDIVPEQSYVEAVGDHLYVKMQKVFEPPHGYCAWHDLAAGNGRKPFRYDEEAPDGGLMDFLEGQYEKYEGHDSYRRDVGKAMEQVHRREPLRGIADTTN
eukprot:TRINITY_DN44375_c0_g1_i1.p1 TRINITY_DN44375_c0_g1~~TRINITY_DN44375_c0_g1_i1.p1  ORF type:complete len:314 (+),score=70.09 TRINITY_DN44375_c0_g1_i1:41-982(+)